MDEKFTNDLRNAKSVEEFCMSSMWLRAQKDAEESKRGTGKGRDKGRQADPCSNRMSDRYHYIRIWRLRALRRKQQS